jgi:hypothetical protein
MGCNDPFSVVCSELETSEEMRGATACAPRKGATIVQAASQPHICRENANIVFIDILIDSKMEQ